jgi:hypothetical protein
MNVQVMPKTTSTISTIIPCKILRELKFIRIFWPISRLQIDISFNARAIIASIRILTLRARNWCGI